MKNLITARVAWIALAAALLHLLLPAVHAATMQPGFVSVICSTMGTTALPAPMDDGKSKGATSCPLCLAVAQALAVPPAPGPVVVAAPHLSYALAGTHEATPAPSPQRIHFLSRAPPPQA